MTPKIEIVTETGSTNADLLARIEAGETVPEGAWLRAERQTGGRGRVGKVWLSPPGNLFCSTVVNLTPDDHPAPSISLVAGLAVHDLLRGQLMSGTIRPLEQQRWLKWPNDVLYDGAKMAGILCERRGGAVVVGIGINVAVAPAIDGSPTISIHQQNGHNDNDPGRVLEYLAPLFGNRLERWRREPLAATIVEWEARAHERGSPISVAEGAGRLHGTFDGLELGGALRLRLADGTVRVIHAGDVTLEGT
ncbi:MAG TPA: biotin--[acetyl-CoA-carboxylase] ligase [Croceibacterium sp.]|nr:biotin--[acetyl-CoA-carboxylase] ligase [Croceibacterium sp.]